MSLLIMYATLSNVSHRVILNHCTIPYGVFQCQSRPAKKVHGYYTKILEENPCSERD
jgi:hypothetical protein